MRKTKIPILEAVHATARGLHKAGVMDQVTLREFDRLCAPPVAPLAPEQIKQIREATHVSQAVFARLLNTSLSTVQKWGSLLAVDPAAFGAFLNRLRELPQATEQLRRTMQTVPP